MRGLAARAFGSWDRRRRSGPCPDPPLGSGLGTLGGEVARLDLVPIDADDAEVLKADLLNPGMQGFGGSWRSLAPLAAPSPSGSSRFHLLLRSDSYRMERPVIRAGIAPAEDPNLFNGQKRG